jgi:hypothetical protein
MPRKPIYDAPMTNAERARRYRDRKRGAPARHPTTTMSALARESGASRTLRWRARVIAKWAPEFVPLVKSGDMRIGRAFPIAQQRRDSTTMKAITDSES